MARAATMAGTPTGHASTAPFVRIHHTNTRIAIRDISQVFNIAFSIFKRLGSSLRSFF